MTIKVLKPEKCSSDQLNAFFGLVIEGNQVSRNGLMKRIKAADFLSFCELDNKVIGVASIKNPDNNYKKSTFKSANVEELADKFDYEIGYAVTKETHRRRGISEQLIKSLINNSTTKSFYATTKNDGMRSLLEKVGFSKLGDDFLNDNNETLTLYQHGITFRHTGG